jgi:hypothetical protein
MSSLGLRPSALAISTSWRRDSAGSQLHQVQVFAATAASNWQARRHCSRLSIMRSLGRIGDADLSATVRSGGSGNSWKMQTMPSPVGLARRREADLAAFQHHAAAIGWTTRR